MESNSFKYLADNKPLRHGLEDKNSPFSYLEWKGRLPGLIEKDSYSQYNSYVLEWFARNKQTVVSSKFALRQKYMAMLDQLKLFFSSDELNTWYEQINLADEKELLISIPYFARKLRDISLYYLNLRKKLKNTKIAYNVVGSTQGVQTAIYDYFLETFSSKNNELAPITQTTVPPFSALQDSLSIQIEELYDDKQYFDISSTQPLSGYFDFLNKATAGFLATKGIVLSSSQWLFESFGIPVTPDNFATMFSQMTGTIFETSDSELFTDYVQKYIAENKFSIQFVPQLTSVSTSVVKIEPGNNRFFYPYGTTSSVFSIEQQLPFVALSSLNIGNATSGYTPEESDTMIIRYGNASKAAWLRTVDYKDSNKEIKATLKKDTKTRFIYPFPGYGLSGTNLPWTGSSLETKPEYNFLSTVLKANVDQAYWSQELPKDTCTSIWLNNTTLASGGATANVDPRFADHVYIRPERNTDLTLPEKSTEGAWLYKFTKTALPISPTDQNVFLWPYTRLDTTTPDPIPAQLKEMDMNKVCNPVSIQSLNTSNFVAGSSIETADRIFKLNKYSDPEQSALECAWLSAGSTSTTNFNFILQTGIEQFKLGKVNGYTYIDQDGFSALFAAGEMVRFIWTGPNQTPLKSVFSSPPHKKDCPFRTNVPAVSAFDWPKCTCKQVYHAPFGHAFRTFAEGNYLADCIFTVPDVSLDLVDFGSWRDTYNRTLSGGGPFTAQFAWYRTSKNYTWGGGKWVSDSNLGQDAFSLYTGKCYIYRRANFQESTSNLPPYAAKYNYFTDKTVWVEAKRTEGDDGALGWTSTNKKSVMNLYPGDLIKVSRQTSTTYTFLETSIAENVSQNKNSIWSTYDVIPFQCGTANTTTISWPVTPRPFGSVDVQYPSVSLIELAYIQGWRIDRGQDRAVSYYFNPPPPPSDNGYGVLQPNLLNTITFVPPSTGTYFVSVTGVKHDGTFVVYNSATIPPITAIPQYRTAEYTATDFTVPAAGFLLEHDLRGWNYNQSKPDVNSSGAKPYWAKLDVDKNPTTRFKGIYSWGYPEEFIDEYLPNSNPIVSPLKFDYGDVIEYDRKGFTFEWIQPTVYRTYSGTTQWCNLSVDFTSSSNLSSFYRIKKLVDPTAAATTIPSDIVLSNKVDGSPLEIFYYAMNDFEWEIPFEKVEEATIPSLSSYFISTAPWNNLANRFNPTIANIPVVEQIYSVNDVGGYFLPQNLGASQFVNKDYDVYLKSENLSGTYLTENISIHIGGRGITKEDQDSVFDWKENNQWIKETVTTGDLAGAPKKSLTKTLQTFIPYQSNIEETALGLITTRSRFSPWGGVNDEEWTDKTKEFKGYTGIRNVGRWAEGQIIKQNQKDIHNWTSDIYGNQYGLFKTLSGIPLSEQDDVFGELWVKTNNQNTELATNSLSAIFTPFKALTGAVDVYSEYTQNKIQIFDCYADTLFIKTPSLALFAKIEYEYDSNQITMTFDDARWQQLGESVEPLWNYKFEKNWYFSKSKKIVSLYTKTNNGVYFPMLFELNLDTRVYQKIYDFSKESSTNTVLFTNLEKAQMHFNEGFNSFLLTYTGFDLDNKMFVTDFTIKYLDDKCFLTDVKTYKDLFETANTITEPPVVVPNYLSAIDVEARSQFAVAVEVQNSPTSCALLNYNSNTSVTLLTGTTPAVALFTGTLSAGFHHINYKLSNSIGDSLYSLSLSAIKTKTTFVKIQIESESASVLANNNDGVLTIVFSGGLSAYNFELDGIYKGENVPPDVPVYIPNLEAKQYLLTVYDQYVGIRQLNVSVGYTGLAALSQIRTQSYIVEGYPLNRIFEI